MAPNDRPPIAWTETGSDPLRKDQETIVFLHAMAGSRTAWSPQMKAFGQAGYRCVAWDMPGFGDSASASETLDMDGVVALLAEFVAQALSINQAHFVGLSVGGMILQHFAAAQPALCRSIAILDSSPKFGFGGDMKPTEFSEPILEQLAGGVSPDDFAATMINAIVGPDCQEAIKQECIAAMARAQISGLALATRLIAGHDAVELLNRIACPVLVMAGEQDAETPPAYAHAIAERIPGAEVVIIPQAGHLVNLEQPEAVNGALMRFLQDCEKGRAL